MVKQWIVRSITHLRIACRKQALPGHDASFDPTSHSLEEDPSQHSICIRMVKQCILQASDPQQMQKNGEVLDRSKHLQKGIRENI